MTEAELLAGDMAMSEAVAPKTAEETQTRVPSAKRPSSALVGLSANSRADMVFGFCSQSLAGECQDLRLDIARLERELLQKRAALQQKEMISNLLKETQQHYNGYLQNN